MKFLNVKLKAAKAFSPPFPSKKASSSPPDLLSHSESFVTKIHSYFSIYISWHYLFSPKNKIYCRTLLIFHENTLLGNILKMIEITASKKCVFSSNGNERKRNTRKIWEQEKRNSILKKLIYDYTFWHLMPNIINPFVKGILPPVSHIFWIKFYWSIYVSCEIWIQLWKSLVIEFWCIRKLIKDQKRSLVYLKFLS